MMKAVIDYVYVLLKLGFYFAGLWCGMHFKDYAAASFYMLVAIWLEVHKGWK